MRPRAEHSSTRRGFTLVELLVVVGIIAVLIAILLPALSRARKSSATAKCLANLRTIMQGTQLYANDNDGFLPYTGLDDQYGTRKGGSGSNPGTYRANWLFDPAATASTTAYTASDVETGALWNYIGGKHEVYRCPLDDSPSTATNFNFLSSYVMNDLLSNENYDNGGGTVNAGTNGNHPLHRVIEFHPTNAAFWDYPGGGTAIGPACAPGAPKTISGRHTNGAGMNTSAVAQASGGVCTVFIDGHTEIWPLYSFQDNLNVGGPPSGASALWCSPTAVNGGWDNNQAHDLSTMVTAN